MGEAPCSLINWFGNEVSCRRVCVCVWGRGCAHTHTPMCMCVSVCFASRLACVYLCLSGPLACLADCRCCWGDSFKKPSGGMLLSFNGEFFCFLLLIEEPIIKIGGGGGTINENDWEEEGPFSGKLKWLDEPSASWEWLIDVWREPIRSCFV